MKPSAHWSSKMLWIIHLALLAVLLPHTAWAFARFEPPMAGWLGVSWGVVTSWAGTFAAAIVLDTSTGEAHLDHSYLCSRPRNAPAFLVLPVASIATIACASLHYVSEVGALRRTLPGKPALFTADANLILPNNRPGWMVAHPGLWLK